MKTDTNIILFLRFSVTCVDQNLCIRVKGAKRNCPEVNRMLKSVIAISLAALLTGNTAAAYSTPINSCGSFEETILTVEDQEIFDEATADLDGFHYEAIQMIEKQLVNGTNYKFIAKSTAASPGAKPKTVQVTVHQSLSGELSIIEIRAL